MPIYSGAMIHASEKGLERVCAWNPMLKEGMHCYIDALIYSQVTTDIIYLHALTCMHALVQHVSMAQ